MLQLDKIPTPHISAKYGDFARTVLMPGDPLRSKFIAEHFLADAVLVNNVRGVQGYTGYYQGKRVSVMASGMGMPSMGIYCYELFNFYDVDCIIRVGSAGGIGREIKTRDLVIATSASTTIDYETDYTKDRIRAFAADPLLAERAIEASRALDIDAKVGSLFSTYVFYDDRPKLFEHLRAEGYLAIEMEAAALYHTAALTGKQALCICTVSDCPLEGVSLSSDERQNSFTDMMKVALQTALD